MVDDNAVDLASHLQATASRVPNRTALRWQGQGVSYGELDDRVTAAAGGLQSLGATPGDRVAIMAGNTPRFVEAFLASVRCGAVAVPINTALTGAEVADILVDADASVFVFAESEVDVLEPVRSKLPDIVSVMTGARQAIDGVGATWNDVVEGGAAFETVDRAPDDLAALVYTSGTTGRPRGAMLTHRNLASNQDQALETRLTIRGDDVVLAALPLFHIYALNVGLGGAIRTGATLLLVERFDPVRTLELIQDEGVTVVLGAPPMYVAWLNTPGVEHADLSSVRIAVSGAAPLPTTVLVRFRDELGVTIWEGYGLTEAAPAVTTNAAGPSAKPGSVGLPLPGVEIRLVDDDGRDVTPGDPGEIWVRGDNVFQGYWNDDEATREVLTEDGWLKTGDVGIRDEDGYLHIVDRKNDLILVSGFNVYPREVERVLEGHPKIVQAAVVGAPHPYTGEAVNAFVVPAAETDLTEDEVVEWCGRRLARFKCPEAVEFVPSLPHTATGKVQRRQLRERTGR